MKTTGSIAILFSLSAILALGGCGRTASAPRTVGGEAVTIFVLTDSGVKEGANRFMQAQHQSISRWMESDLVKQLEKAGYKTRVIRDRGEFVAGPGNYLLKTTVTEVNGGSVGSTIGIMAAGGETLHSRYELFGEGPQPLLSNEEGVGSSRSLRHCAQKRNTQTVEALNAKLGEKP